MKSLYLASIATASFLFPALANAQPAGAPPSQLPPPQSSQDARPMAPRPEVASTSGVTEQAGIGGTQAYARAGVLELGGGMSFAGASNNTIFTFTPSVGWFPIDNIELSLLINLSYAKSTFSETVNGATISNSNTATVFTGLIEPSFHLPFTPTVFGFLGVGVGVAAANNGVGAGLALAPRLGINVLIGRSGVLTPFVDVAYAGTKAVQTPSGQDLVGVSTTYGFGAAYSVMW